MCYGTVDKLNWTSTIRVVGGYNDIELEDGSLVDTPSQTNDAVPYCRGCSQTLKP